MAATRAKDSFFITLRINQLIGNRGLISTFTRKVNNGNVNQIRLCSKFYSSTSDKTGNKSRFQYEQGFPVISVPLRNRAETYRFILKPYQHTLGDFYKFILEEDPDIENLSASNCDGELLASSTPIEFLLKSNFTLKVDDASYSFNSILKPDDNLKSHEDIKNSIAKLYSTLNLEQYRHKEENIIQEKLESLKDELKPLEEKREVMELNALKRIKNLSWIGLGLMSLQFGLLARLTWWEYSWDIMEPVTYFITYGTAIGMFAYYVVTKQDYNFVEVGQREHLLSFYKQAPKMNFDLEKYNKLKHEICDLELNLKAFHQLKI